MSGYDLFIKAIISSAGHRILVKEKYIYDSSPSRICFCSLMKNPPQLKGGDL